MRVVIVDDEHLVQLGIRTYLQSAGETYEVSGVFADGGAALEGLRREPADILLTDIKMPVMGGIDLIRAVRREGLARSIVVLSCHDEFDLVRDAFTSGADEYVLKHEVEQNELLGVLERLGGATPPAQRGGSAPVADLGSLARDLPVVVAAYRFRGDYDDDHRLIPWVADPVALDAEIRAALSGCAPAVHVPGPEVALLVVGLRDAGEVAPERRARHAAREVLARVRRYWNREMQVLVDPDPRPLASVAVDRPHDDPTARRLRERALYLGGDVVVIDDGAAPGEAPVVPRILLGEPDAPDVWVAAVRRYLTAAAEVRLPASHVQLALSGMLHQLDRDLSATVDRSLHEVMAAEADGGHPAPSLVAQLDTFDDATRIADWLEGVLRRVAVDVEAVRRRRSHIGQVLAHLDATFHEPVRLADLAARFSISKAYLCSRVREETGFTISQYVNRRRIERARDLLRTTDRSAKEICFAVGYDNPNYFSRVFKHVTGESITAFRNSVNDPKKSVRGADPGAPLQ